MFSVLNKKVLWTIVVWFAILQMLSPLIHAHIEADAPGQGYGLHVHVQDSFQAQDKTTQFRSIANSLHTVGVDQALVKNLDLLPLPLFAVLFVITSLVVISQSPGRRFSFLPSPPLYLRSLSRPRAPPLF